MEKKIEDILKTIEKMSILEVNELVKGIEEKFDVKAVAAVGAAPSAGGDASASEPTEVNVILKAIGGNKVAIIKLAKEITGMGLMEAKKLIEAAPVNIKEKIKPEEANEIAAKFKEAGAEVEVK